MQEQKSGQSGFSLVELLIAIMILAVGLLGLAELQITAMKGNSKSGSVVAASLVAQTALEDIMAVRRDDDPLYATVLETTVDVEADWPVDPVRTLEGSGRYKITFKSTPDIGGPDSRIVRIEVFVRSQDVIGFGPTLVSYQALKDLRRIIKL